MPEVRKYFSLKKPKLQLAAQTNLSELPNGFTSRALAELAAYYFVNSSRIHFYGSDVKIES